VDAGYVSRQAWRVAHVFTLEEARGLLPEVRAHAAELIVVRADLVDLQTALNHGVPSPLGSLPEAKGLEARLSELLSWFPEHGLDVKGVAPLLLDFPARRMARPSCSAGWRGKMSSAGTTSRSTASLGGGPSPWRAAATRPDPRPAASRSRAKPVSDVR
jgi:Uncharacterized conserved protein (DUF2203)